MEAALAFYFDAPERGLGFTTLDFDRPPATKRLEGGSSVSGSIRPYGLVYVVLDPGVESVRVEAALNGPALVAWLATDTDPIEVRAVELDTETPIDAPGTVLVLTSPGSAGYAVTAS
ncbi:MAG: hypothetical protein DIU78_008760 [Pseudomonadota bacterium]|nr:MAG: hypothetical protein DIU78_16055 [Pseudomonadota bacterium]